MLESCGTRRLAGESLYALQYVAPAPDHDHMYCWDACSLAVHRCLVAVTSSQHVYNLVTGVTYVISLQSLSTHASCILLYN